MRKLLVTFSSRKYTLYTYTLCPGKTRLHFLQNLNNKCHLVKLSYFWEITQHQKMTKFNCKQPTVLWLHLRHRWWWTILCTVNEWIPVSLRSHKSIGAFLDCLPDWAPGLATFSVFFLLTGNKAICLPRPGRSILTVLWIFIISVLIVPNFQPLFGKFTKQPTCTIPLRQKRFLLLLTF